MLKNITILMCLIFSIQEGSGLKVSDYEFGMKNLTKIDDLIFEVVSFALKYKSTSKTLDSFQKRIKFNEFLKVHDKLLDIYFQVPGIDERIIIILKKILNKTMRKSKPTYYFEPI